MKKKTNRKVFLKLAIVLLLFASVCVTNSIAGKLVVYNWKSLVARNDYAVENTSDNRIYIKNNDGEDILNNHKNIENPYTIVAGEQINFYAKFDEKQTTDGNNYNYKATVYENNGILDRTVWDNWTEDGKQLNFGFVARNPGVCKVAIYLDSEGWGTATEWVWVKVILPDTIYFKDLDTGEYVINPFAITVDVDREFEFMSILTNISNLKDGKPSDEAWKGSGFWTDFADNVKFTNDWEKLPNNKWLLTSKCKVNKEGSFTLNLSKDGNPFVNVITLNSIHNKIFINDIKVGTKEYDNINKNTATKMFNGRVRGNNSSNNRYTVYVGESLNISVDTKSLSFSGAKFENKDSNLLSKVKEETDKNGVLNVTFRGLKPGQDEISLKNDKGETVETFYIEVHYPIFVNTAIGNYSKDTVHEYLSYSHEGLYNTNPDWFIINPDGTPLYLKNGPGYWSSYWLNTGDTVILSAYMKSDENTTFTPNDGVEIVDIPDYNYTSKSDKVVVAELSGDRKGFKKVTAAFKVTANQSQVNEVSVKFGNETFYIGLRDTKANANHFDIEVEDGGTYIVREITTAKTRKVIAETLYFPKVSEVYGSTVMDKSEKTLGELKEFEYWKRIKPVETQYEITSAYRTNADRLLVDENDKVIQTEILNGNRMPVVKSRNILLSEVSKVRFKVKLDLVPVKKTITTINLDKDGKEVKRDSVVEKLNSNEKVEVDNVTIDMGYRDIIDALNKCPDHSGLDFTFNQIVKEKNIISNPVTSSTISLIIILAVLASLGYGFYSIKFKKN